MTSNKNFIVRAVQSDWRADDETVYQNLKRATQPLTKAWAKLRKARKHRHQVQPGQRKRVTIVTYEHHRTQLVSDCVARATLRLLRENTTAELYCMDVSFYRHYVPQAKDERHHPVAPCLQRV